MLYQVLEAPNDHNGNPRRVTMVYDPTDGEILKAILHGYKGNQIPGGSIQLPTVQIQPTEYWQFTHKNAPYTVERN